MTTNITKTKQDKTSVHFVGHTAIGCTALVRMGLLPDTQHCRLRMRRECRERFPRHQLQRTPLVNDHGMHHSTCVTHVPWCMSGSLTRGGGENVPSIPGTCATRNFTYLVRGPWSRVGSACSLKGIFYCWCRMHSCIHPNDLSKQNCRKYPLKLTLNIFLDYVKQFRSFTVKLQIVN